MQRIVIVGNGIAGMTAADSLRAEGFAGDLVIVGDEQHHPYSRPALSKALLRDAEDLTSHLLPPPTHGATQLRGVRAVSLDPEQQTIALDNGQELSFDGLVIATGCRSRLLRTASVPQTSVRTLDDAIDLRRRIHAKPSVIVIGGGPLGMELASGALDAGCSVTVVSQGPPLHLQLGDYLSNVFVRAALSRGLTIVDTAEATVEPMEGSADVVLADGSVLTADLVVTAVGDVANVEWLESSGLLREGALVTDAVGRVRPNIVAAGDVATVPTPMGQRRVPLWSAAIEQAKVAAKALLDCQTGDIAATKPYFWTEQFGLSLKAVGHLPFRGEPTVLEDDPQSGKLLLRWDGDKSTGGAAAAITSGASSV